MAITLYNDKFTAAGAQELLFDENENVIEGPLKWFLKTDKIINLKYKS